MLRAGTRGNKSNMLWRRLPDGRVQPPVPTAGCLALKTTTWIGCTSPEAVQCFALYVLCSRLAGNNGRLISTVCALHTPHLYTYSTTPANSSIFHGYTNATCGIAAMPLCDPFNPSRPHDNATRPGIGYSLSTCSEQKAYLLVLLLLPNPSTVSTAPPNGC